MLKNKAIKYYLIALLIFFFTKSEAQWVELGGQNSLNVNGNITTLCTDKLGNIYASGNFTSNLNFYNYVAKYDGNSWTELGNDSVFLPAALGVASIVSDSSNNIYAAGYGIFGGSISYGVAKWNGNQWSEIGTSNDIIHGNAPIYKIAFDKQGYLYAVGGLYDSINPNFYPRFVAKWNGANWQRVGSGTNALNANNYITSIIFDSQNNLYVAGHFTNSNGKSYVAKWNGNYWQELGTGINALNPDGPIWSMTIDKNNNIYVTSPAIDISYSATVAKWNGINWSKLQVPTPDTINHYEISSFITDANNNLYCDANFINSNGNRYLQMYTGNSWIEFGETQLSYLNGNILSFCIDKNGYLYGAGNLANQIGVYYVAKCESPTVIKENIIFNSYVNIYPNPNSGSFTIELKTNNNSNKKYKIINSVGSIIRDANFTGNKCIIEESHICNGIYTLIINDGDNQFTQKFIVTK